MRPLHGALARIPTLAGGLLSAAVGLACAVVLLSAGIKIAGPAPLRDHANGAIVSLLGMGVPVQWSAADGAATGSASAAQHPALLAATVVVAGVTLAIGWARAGRRPHHAMTAVVGPAATWFAALAGVLAVVISYGRPIELAGVPVRLSASAPLSVGAAGAWAVVGMTLGALLARRVVTARERPVRQSRRWLVHGPGAIAVAAAVAVVGASACGTSGSPSLAAAEKRARKTAGAANTTTSTTVATTTSAAPSTTAAAAATAIRPSTTRGTTTPGRASTQSASAAAMAAGFAPPAAGTYHYATTGSTTSLLGKKTFPSVTTLAIDPASASRQHSVRRLMSPNGEGFIIEQTLDYRPDGVAVVQQRLSLTQSGDKTVRTLNARPPTVVIPPGAPVGTHREFDLSGMLDGREVVDIVEAGSVTVAGQSIPTVRVRTLLNVTGSVSGTIQLDQWWAPSIRLPLKESLTGTFKSGLVTVKTQYEATLQRVTP